MKIVRKAYGLFKLIGPPLIIYLVWVWKIKIYSDFIRVFFNLPRNQESVEGALDIATLTAIYNVSVALIDSALKKIKSMVEFEIKLKDPRVSQDATEISYGETATPKKLRIDGKLKTSGAMLWVLRHLLGGFWYEVTYHCDWLTLKIDTKSNYETPRVFEHTDGHIYFNVLQLLSHSSLEVSFEHDLLVECNNGTLTKGDIKVQFRPYLRGPLRRVVGAKLYIFLLGKEVVSSHKMVLRKGD